jgi:hypothetical protein
LNGYRGPARPSPKGVRDRIVWVLGCEDLCAVVSDGALPVSGSGRGLEVSAHLPDLLAYTRVMEAFNRCETIVPIRYGCTFQGLSDVRLWLRRNAGRLRSLLLRLDGCVEMGVELCFWNRLRGES